MAGKGSEDSPRHRCAPSAPLLTAPSAHGMETQLPAERIASRPITYMCVHATCTEKFLFPFYRDAQGMIDCLYGKQITMCLYRDTHDLFSQTTTPQKENVSSIFHSFGPTSSHNPNNPRWLSRSFQESLKDLFLRIQVLISLHFIVAASCCCCCFYFSLASTYTRESTRQKLDYPQIVHWFISLSQAFNEEKRNHINNSTKSCRSPEFSWTWGSGGEDKKGVWVATWMDSSSAYRQAWHGLSMV